ncbi:cytochrome P450 [Kibdelosporangium lantanae]
MPAEHTPAAPFDLGPDGPSPELLRRLADAPLDGVTMPSGQVAHLAVRYADVKQVLSDPRFTRELAYAGAPTYFPGEDPTTADPDFLATMGPPRHNQVRRIVANAFSARRVEKWRPTVQRIADRLVAEIVDGPKPADFVADFAFQFTIQVIVEVIGIPDEDRDRFRGWTTASAVANMGSFLEYVEGLLARRRQEPGNGLLDELIAARDGDDRLTEKELVRLVIAMLVAGHETTGSTLSRGLFTLLADRALYKNLVAKPELVPDHVREILRLHPAVEVSLLRVATEDVRLPSGGTVAKGEPVIASLTGANLDPEVFGSNACPFDPARASGEHLSFGHGMHFCLGSNVARIELEVALSTVVNRLPDLRLAVDPAEVVSESDTVIRSLPRLPITW